MQILCDNRENIDLCEIKKALDIDPRLEVTGLCNVIPDHSNLMTMGANFYSHPNIYTPPGGSGGGGIYGSGQLKYQSPSAAAALFGPSPLSPSVPLQCQLATGSGPLFPSSSSAITGMNCYPGGGAPFDLLSSPTTMAMCAGSGGRRYNNKANVNYLFAKPGSYACPPFANSSINPNTNLMGHNNLPGMNASYYPANSSSGYPWHAGSGGGGIGNPLSLNQRLMAGLDCAYPSTVTRNCHYGSHPTISKYSNAAGRSSAFLSQSHNNYFHNGIGPSGSNLLTSSAISNTSSCYPSSFMHDGPLGQASSGYTNPMPYSTSSSPGYNHSSYGHHNPYSHLHQQHSSYYPHRGPYGGGSGSFQQPPRSLPLSYYPAYKVSSAGAFYNGTRHGGSAFNANSLSRVGAANLVGASAGDMKRQVSFKFDVDQLSIGS